jgi:hypothetical protein
LSQDFAAEPPTAEQLGRGRLVTVELGEMTVSVGVVVVGIDHDLAGERCGRERINRAEWDSHENDLAEPHRIVDPRAVQRLADLVLERLEALGARRFAIASSWPAATKRRGAVDPIMPLPMIAIFIFRLPS